MPNLFWYLINLIRGIFLVNTIYVINIQKDISFLTKPPNYAKRDVLIGAICNYFVLTPLSQNKAPAISCDTVSFHGTAHRSGG